MGNSVYRGVHANHPALADAMAGIATPANPSGPVTAQMHNLGGHSYDSPFTSWTHDYSVAETNARKRGSTGGVILVAQIGPPPRGAQWAWEHSPDVWREQEVLLRGVRSGLQVIKL